MARVSVFPSVALSRVRGLKREAKQEYDRQEEVALSRVRGLKLPVLFNRLLNDVSHSHECVD